MSDHVAVALAASVMGLVSGFLISIPTGPISVTIINEGARRGFRWAAMIGLGGVAMDLIYCSVAFAGFSQLFSSRVMRAAMELLSFLATLYLGIKYLWVKELTATSPSAERVEHKLHPHTAFAIGFVRILANPAVLLFWVTLAAAFISHQVIEDTLWSKAWCVFGMSSGALLWFLLLAFIISRGHGRFSTRTLVRMSHVSGAAMLCVALLIGIRLIRVLSLHP
jgi:threonine/homoserine/homoserine lactone efflux protein